MFFSRHLGFRSVAGVDDGTFLFLPVTPGVSSLGVLGCGLLLDGLVRGWRDKAAATGVLCPGFVACSAPISDCEDPALVVVVVVVVVVLSDATGCACACADT